MKVTDYLPTGASVQTIATMETTEVGRTILHALRVEKAKRDRFLHRNPKANTENMRDDIRHKLGEIDGLEFIERLRNAAQEVVSGVKSRKNEEDEA